MTLSTATPDVHSSVDEVPTLDAGDQYGVDSVLVTGIGVVAPTGIGAEAHWQEIIAGRSAIRPIQRFDVGRYPVTLAGEIRQFVSRDHVPRHVLPQTDYFTHLGMAAGSLGLKDAQIDPTQLPAYDMSVVTSACVAGMEFGERELLNLWTKGSEYVTAYQSIAWFYAATTGQISIQHGMKGACGVVATEQAGGLDALAQARRVLRENDAKVVIGGGADAPLSPYSFTAQLATGRLSTSTDSSHAYCPFDVNARGFVPGEGGAIFVLESASSALDRGARAYGELAGYAATFDPPPDSGRPPTLRRAIELALADAEVTASQVDVVFADALGVPAMDQAEAQALADVFGPYGIPVTAPKTMTGRLYAGGAALDVATALLAIQESTIPPTVGTTELAPGCEIQLVKDDPVKQSIDVALVLARGLGGFNSALVLRAANHSKTHQEME